MRCRVTDNDILHCGFQCATDQCLRICFNMFYTWHASSSKEETILKFTCYTFIEVLSVAEPNPYGFRALFENCYGNLYELRMTHCHLTYTCLLSRLFWRKNCYEELGLVVICMIYSPDVCTLTSTGAASWLPQLRLLHAFIVTELLPPVPQSGDNCDECKAGPIPKLLRKHAGL